MVSWGFPVKKKSLENQSIDIQNSCGLPSGYVKIAIENDHL